MKIFFFVINFLVFFNLNASNICDDFYKEIRNQGKSLSLYEPYNQQIANYVDYYLEATQKQELNEYAKNKDFLYDLYSYFYDEYLPNDVLYDNSYQKLKKKYGVEKKEIHEVLKSLIDHTIMLYGINYSRVDGINIDRDNEGNFKIYNTAPGSAINQKLKDSEFSNDLTNLKLHSLNGIKISEIDDEEAYRIANSSKSTKVEIKKDNKIISLDLEKKFFYPRVPLYPELEILSINNIDEKDSSFEISTKINLIWDDQRLANIFKKIYEKEFGSIEEKINSYNRLNAGQESYYSVGGFYCDLNSLDEIYAEDLFIYFPDYQIVNKYQSNTINEIQKLRFWFSYYDDYSIWLEINYTKENDLVLFTDMDLRSYPFDKQILKILYAIKDDYSSQDKIEVIPYDGFNIKYSNLKKLFNWEINTDNLSFKQYIHDDEYEGMEVSIVAERNSNYFIYKILSPIFLILIVCWSVLLIHPRQIESRLTVSIVCFLTLIAYNFVIDQDLPKLGYLTLIDYILLISYIYSATPTIISIFEFKYLEKDNILKINRNLLITGIFSYLLLIYFFLNLSANNEKHINSFLKAITL